ncbi:MAG: YggS family pyridoxal phosphate-dependent enzyme [Cyclobacteriaceae bacterium]|nr:YggS family pyridoxal phosphate-dependent enzyme [Cyclobacteriaceae bacterium]
MVIKNNIKAIKEELSAFSYKLVAVSKTQPIERLQEAYDAGQRIFGENKAQELALKYKALPKDIEWHMIGHLQTNKVKYIAPFVALIHSIDSIKLLEEVDKQGKKVNRKISCLLQVHIAKEETKFGFDLKEVKELMNSQELNNFSHVEIKGLMGMATFTENQEQIRNEFSLINQLFQKLKTQKLPTNVEMKELSIGMSADYKIAIEEGSTIVRVGTAIFGARNYN